MSKSPDAFRTISEVAEWLETPAHVLRFWESKFTQVKPVKRAGGRRYYRPADMELLGGIKTLLHHDGMTIKGVQKILREEGVKHVASLSLELAEQADEDDQAELIAEAPFTDVPEPDDIVVPFSQPVSEDVIAADEEVTPELEALAEPELELEPEPKEDATPEPTTLDLAPGQDILEEAEAETELGLEEGVAPEPTAQETTPEPDVSEKDAAEPVVADSFAADPDHSPLPDFLQNPLSDDVADDVESQEPADEEQLVEADELEAPEKAESPLARAPRILPENPDLDAIEPAPYCLSHLSKLTKVTLLQAEAMAPIAARLRALVASAEAGRRS
ncbi:DNA-binding transcriptional regulator, MerR family [Puniceibacterium sediminis]|uniref:DNA-binding transcriptional regulator, MerR family n=2 Tax=Puniceibacterium sediminis TaxID=1608407 RepID=A0A238XK07_9RHOB|nr:DNA-binding transcriptional regulator, MerR family [Puniceibacterium sediminis]